MRMRYLPLVIVAVILSASSLFAQVYMGGMRREGAVGSTQMVYSSHLNSRRRAVVCPLFGPLYIICKN